MTERTPLQDGKEDRVSYVDSHARSLSDSSFLLENKNNIHEAEEMHVTFDTHHNDNDDDGIEFERLRTRTNSLMESVVEIKEAIVEGFEEVKEAFDEAIEEVKEGTRHRSEVESFVHSRKVSKYCLPLQSARLLYVDQLTCVCS